MPTLVLWLLAFAPIVAVLVLMVGFRYLELGLRVIPAGCDRIWRAHSCRRPSTYWTGLSCNVAPWSALMLGIACIPCGLVPAYLHDGWTSLRHSFPVVLVIGVVMAGVQ